MNFAELKEELFARGTNYLEEDSEGIARAERWLNQAYRDIANLQAWPFLLATAIGVAGTGTVQVADFRKAILVVDSDSGSLTEGRVLQRVDPWEIMKSDGERLTTTGTPQYYYVSQQPGATEIAAFPVGGTIVVHYVQRLAPLTGTDSPIFDEEYHDLIVDGAMVKAYKDSDNFEAAAALQEEMDRRLAAMAEDYLLESRGPTFIEPFGSDM